MRACQHAFHQAVGIPAGLSRLGPGRRRLTRAQWHAEKSAASAAAQAIEAAHLVETNAVRTQEQAAATQQIAAARTAAAPAAHEKAVAAIVTAKTMMAAVNETAAKAAATEKAADQKRAAAELYAATIKTKAKNLPDRTRAACAVDRLSGRHAW
jgi:hypothetical protein